MSNLLAKFKLALDFWLASLPISVLAITCYLQSCIVSSQAVIEQSPVVLGD